MGLVNTLVMGAIGLTVLFLLASTLILPYFSTAYRFCSNKQWEGATGGVYTNCSNRYQDAFNQTPVPASGGYHTENGETNPVDSDSLNSTQFCLNCSVLGGYRTTIQGLTVLVLVLALIFFGVKYLKR